MDVSPATIEQVRQGRTGRVVTVTAAESTVAKDLDRLGKEVGTSFLLRWHEETGHWSVIQKYGPREDDEQLVATTTSSEYLPVVFTKIQRAVNGHRDLAADADAQDAAAQRAQDHDLNEKVGERAERAYHTYRKLSGNSTSRAFFKAR